MRSHLLGACRITRPNYVDIISGSIEVRIIPVILYSYTYLGYYWQSKVYTKIDTNHKCESETDTYIPGAYDM